MSSIKISQLTAASALDGTEQIPLVQGTDTVKTTSSSFVRNELNTPKMISDVYVNRPISDYTGTVFISTDTKQIFRYNGAAWDLIANSTYPGLQAVLNESSYVDDGFYFLNSSTDNEVRIKSDLLSQNREFQMPDASGTLGLALGYTAENQANKSTDTNLGTSNTLYPTQNAVKAYVDANAGGGVIQSVKVSFSSAQLLTLTAANRLQLIPAQGAGTLIRPISFTFKYNYGTVPYSITTLNINFNGIGSNMVSSSILNTTNNITYWYGVGNGYYQDPFDGSNTSLTLNSTSTVSGGDGTLDVYINYEVITL